MLIAMDRGLKCYAQGRILQSFEHGGGNVHNAWDIEALDTWICTLRNLGNSTTERTEPHCTSNQPTNHAQQLKSLYVNVSLARGEAMKH